MNTTSSVNSLPTNVQLNATDRSLLDQPTYIEKLTAAVEQAERNAELCANCGQPSGEHSGTSFHTGISGYCPDPAGFYRQTTFHKHGLCEGSIPEYNDPTGENAKPCGSRFGTYRPEREQVLCDGCAEGM